MKKSKPGKLLDSTGRELPAKPPKRSISERLVDLQKKPVVTVLLTLLIPCAGWIGQQYERFVVQPKKDAENALREKELAIREGRYYAPVLNMSFNGDRCVLLNEDTWPVLEATLVLNTFYVDLEGPLASLTMPRHSAAPASARELKPRGRLELLRVLEPKTCDASALGLRNDRTVIIVECEAQVLRAGDRRRYRVSKEAYLDDKCGGHHIKPEDSRIMAAVKRVRTHKSGNHASLEQLLDNNRPVVQAVEKN